MLRLLFLPTVAGLLTVPALAHERGWSGYLVEDGYVAAPAVCKPKHGLLEPYVPDPATAKAIFLAVEAAKVPRADRATFPLVDIFDKRDRWVVFRHSATMLGGGQLELEIGKCTGRIRRASFSR